MSRSFSRELTIKSHQNRPRIFFADFVANASSQNVEIVLYSGGSNAIAHHTGLESEFSVDSRARITNLTTALSSSHPGSSTLGTLDSVHDADWSQNTIFGGIRGFTRKPSTPWTDDNGNIVGIVHQERGIVYALFDGVGHMIPNFKPDSVSPSYSPLW